MIASKPPIMIDVQNLLTKIHGQVIHRGLTMQVKRGEVFGIVGGSGTGKTVLLNALLGLRAHQGGQIQLFGVDSAVVNTSFDYKKRMGILFQRGALFSSLSILHNIAVPMIEQGKLDEETAIALAYYKMEMVGLPRDAALKLPEEISGGMVKRTALARALALDADLVFLDEPTSGLDPISAEKFDQLILKLQKNLGLTVVMITHDLGSLAICDRIGVIVDHQMITGPLDEVKKNPHPWIEEYFAGTRSQALLNP